MRYSVLGTIEFDAGAGPRAPASASQRSLLAALLVDRGRTVGLERLAEAVWGDELPADAAAALRTQVLRLRRSLGPAADEVRTAPGGYRLECPSEQVDAECFTTLLDEAASADDAAALELLARASSLWRGRAYEDVPELLAARPEAARLDELRVAGRQRHGELLLRLGRHDEAAAALTALLGEEPEREDVRAALMRARYACGQHTAALELYEQWRALLADERGLDPSPRLRAVHQEVLRHEVLVAAPVAPPSPEPRTEPSGAPLLGRDDDVEALVALLEVRRFVTLVGPGGVGKTRVARALLERIDQPHWYAFCDLTVVRRPADVLRAVAAALGVEERGGASLLDHVVEQVSGRDLLLVLDNCEHVIEQAAALAEQLIQRSPGLRLLATSRERLGADAEQVWQLAPLPCGTVDDPGVQLFLLRAGTVVTPSDLTVELCQRLDGLPLALELAAAQAARWGVDGLMAALDRRLDLLSNGRRGAHRHRSMRSVIAWSYEQLDEQEQRVFDCLCVFAGSFDLPAAEQVAAGGADHTAAGASVMTLLERSLVSTSPTAPGRMHVLENLRAYGLEQLRRRGEEAAARAAHAAWVLGVAQDAAARLSGPDERDADLRLRAVFDELRVAHVWAVESEPDAALRMSDLLCGWALWRNLSEVFRWSEAAARAVGPRPGAAGAWAAAAIGACQRGDLRSARAAVAAARAIDPHGVAVEEAAAEIALLTGDLTTALAGFRGAHHIRVSEGNLLQAVWDLGSAALCLSYSGCTVEAHEVAERTLDVAERAGGPTARAFAHFVLGEVQAGDDVPAAERHLNEAVELGLTSRAPPPCRGGAAGVRAGHPRLDGHGHVDGRVGHVAHPRAPAGADRFGRGRRPAARRDEHRRSGGTCLRVRRPHAGGRRAPTAHPARRRRVRAVVRAGSRMQAGGGRRTGAGRHRPGVVAGRDSRHPSRP
jgi:predicted ATPase/DNA-binding SARP family transcriptional activator